MKSRKLQCRPIRFLLFSMAFVLFSASLSFAGGIKGVPSDSVCHWARDYIYTAYESGLVKGFPDGGFHPGETVNGQDLNIMSERFELPLTFEGEVTRADLMQFGYALCEGKAAQSPEAAAEYLCEKGVIVDPCTEGSFTRAEMLKVIMNSTGSDIAAMPSVSEVELNVPYVSQLVPYGAVVGCEPTSLYMGLLYKNAFSQSDVSLKTFLDAMPKAATNPAKGFVGSPYAADKTKKTRTTIFPEPLARYANAYYPHVYDVSGYDCRQLKNELRLGNPVVVYLTMNWERPFYRKYKVDGVENVRMLSNNHVVLLTGYKPGYYKITDPYSKTGQRLEYWKEAAVFEPIYYERRCAIAVR
ncbi:MAG: C39 family peptidase [Clostridia bacterium]|nr:C39 family peptidase [Clostridia bacterium]